MKTQTHPQSRSVARIVAARPMAEGVGVPIKRPSPPLELFDPFLILDHFGPMDVAPGAGVGFPDHPHRGFETVTYILAGGFEHKDSFGNHGVIRAGDIQWMTAGAGLVHSEMPAADIREQGGRIEGFQLWINLPRAEKMVQPRYQDLSAAQIPLALSADGLVSARVIAGEALGTRGPVETRFPVSYIHFRLKPGASLEQPVGDGQRAFAYIIGGQGLAGNENAAVGAGQLVLFGTEDGTVRISNDAEASEELSVLFLAGRPLHEPIAWYGPFVMNTREELAQAFDDYRAGRMGEIAN